VADLGLVSGHHLDENFYHFMVGMSDLTEYIVELIRV